MAAELARIEGDPARLASIIESAALRSGGTDAHEEMFVRLRPDRIDTPASAPDADQVTFCTARASRFDELSLSVDPPVYALFDVEAVLAWLDWLHAEADGMTAIFVGDPDTGVTERFEYVADTGEVTVPCATDWRREDLSLTVPDRFDGARLLDGDGTPVPTRVRTVAAELERVVSATRLARGEGQYSLAVVDGDLRFDARGPDGSRVTGTLDGTASGPRVTATYGPGFARVVTSLAGEVELQTGPGEPLAIVKDRPEYTLRFVVHRIEPSPA